MTKKSLLRILVVGSLFFIGGVGLAVRAIQASSTLPDAEFALYQTNQPGV